MKSSIILTILLSFAINPSFCQQNAAIKIYLKDAESGKNIKKAQVTLEGLDLVPIKAAYNKSEKCYFFSEIPKGYNTVMARRKHYSEKGFQDISLPKNLTLKMCTVTNVMYDFEDMDSVDLRNGRDKDVNVYVEDPYKIAIISDSIIDYNEFKDYLMQQVKASGADVEIVNPYLEYDRFFFQKFNDLFQKEAYPTLSKGYNYCFTEYWDILPMAAGYCNVDYQPVPLTVVKHAEEIAFYFRQKDGGRFLRYNDPDMLKLSKIRGITVCSVLNNKIRRLQPPQYRYRSKFGKSLDRANNYRGIDSSKIFFYKRLDIYMVNEKYKVERPKTGIILDFIVGPPASSQTLVGHSKKVNAFFLKKIDNLDEPPNQELPQFQPGLGLGILDLYEVISKTTGKFPLNYLEYIISQRE